MSGLESGDTRLLTPEYWNGANITNSALFADVRPSQHQPLTRRERRFIGGSLEYALGQVVADNVTEVHYGTTTEFNPDLPDGSVVAMDHEALLYHDHMDQDRPIGREASSKHADPPITRPYATYWLNNQGRDWNGSSSVELPEEGLVYVRSLSWGVFFTSHDTRHIQQLGFAGTKLRKDGSIQIASIPEPRLTLPIPIGAVQPEPRLQLTSGIMDALYRITAIDVVYPAGGSRGRAPKRARHGLRLPSPFTQPL